MPKRATIWSYWTSCSCPPASPRIYISRFPCWPMTLDCHHPHTKLRRLHLETSDTVLLQVHFHTLFLQSIIGILICMDQITVYCSWASVWVYWILYLIHNVLCTVNTETCLLLFAVFLLVRFIATPSSTSSERFVAYGSILSWCQFYINDLLFRVSFYEVFHVVVISSFGKLSALAAMVWTGDFYLWLPPVLVLPAHFQAYRGEINIHTITLIREIQLYMYM